jgi:hypothetical protein
MSSGVRNLSDADLEAALAEKPTAAQLSDADLRRALIASRRNNTLGAADTAIDVAKSAGSGLVEGTAGLASAPAMILGKLQDLHNWGIAKAQGRTIEDVQAEADAAAWKLGLPTRQTWATKVEPAVTDAVHSVIPEYEPQTQTGQYTKAAASFLPAAAIPGGGMTLLPRLAVGGVVPGLAQEAVGEAAFERGASPFTEKALRVGTAVLAPLAAARAVTPIRTTATRAHDANYLTGEEGVPLTAGQRTGNQVLQYAESQLGNAPLAGPNLARIEQGQKTAYTQAGARRMGENPSPDDLLRGETFLRARTRLRSEYQDLTSRYALDAQQGGLVPRLQQVITDNMPNMTQANQARFQQILQDRVLSKMHNGQMPGVLYQRTRSALDQMSRGARKTDDLFFADGLVGLRRSLDESMGDTIAAGGNPGDLARWQQTNQQWGAMRTLEEAMKGGQQASAEGFLSPAALKSAAQQRNPVRSITGQDDLTELGRAGKAVMTPMPNSGTAQRTALTGGASAIGGGIGALYGGAEGAGYGALAAAAAPSIAGRVLMSAPMQAWLGNQIFSAATDPRIPRMLAGTAASLRRGSRAAAQVSGDDNN